MLEDLIRFCCFGEVQNHYFVLSDITTKADSPSYDAQHFDELRIGVNYLPLHSPVGKISRILQRLWLLVLEIHMEIWVVIEMKIHAENQGKFSNRG